MLYQQCQFRIHLLSFSWSKKICLINTILIDRNALKTNKQKIYSKVNYINKCYCIQFSSNHTIFSQFNVRNIHDEYFIHTNTLENTPQTKTKKKKQ